MAIKAIKGSGLLLLSSLLGWIGLFITMAIDNWIPCYIGLAIAIFGLIRYMWLNRESLQYFFKNIEW